MTRLFTKTLLKLNYFSAYHTHKIMLSAYILSAAFFSSALKNPIHCHNGYFIVERLMNERIFLLLFNGKWAYILHMFFDHRIEA